MPMPTNIPIIDTMLGVRFPGPIHVRAPQVLDPVDEICWFFPELRFVFRHGTEPWLALAVKSMLEWPNLCEC